MTYPKRGTDDPVLRLFPRSDDLNYNGHVGGGWILTQMDLAGGIVAFKRAGGPVVTAGINDMDFIRPVLFGDIASLYVHVEKVGRTSITTLVELDVERQGEREPMPMARGRFIYVAIDAQAHPRPVDLQV